ncbi:MAG: hypothetical protein A3H98_13235 [Bacteroidetes bacterium RIFCSPLOWO2_02_FULL_36_8]|nr:MAG: hypothetical protein A3H98_13235 [Bacteroidetes bacterium RIFCSPLOWO2_02_FULL_36_8]OFY69958.1 MAG: hypothetical protein A3G23_05740 [Bacteroidetes bacterium RIFCSPLOWO2_12_FULL_37_12]
MRWLENENKIRKNPPPTPANGGHDSLFDSVKFKKKEYIIIFHYIIFISHLSFRKHSEIFKKITHHHRA